MSNLYERLSKLSPNRLALLVLDLQAKLDASKQTRPGPIAVIGVGCRFPGGATSPDRFWELLAEGRDAIGEVPRARWDADALFDPNPEAPGKVASRWGGFLEDLDRFDAEFFGISPREALSLDPQQRLVLEVGWEALEHAGYAPDKLHGSATGVFLGICNGDYGRNLLSQEPGLLDAYAATGNAYSVASGRLSYVLGLQGPSLSVDTACSSSLVAVHLAVQGLRAGDCRMALAGGVNVILSPTTTMALSRARMMASDGRCKAFDAAADGFVRSEGCGFVVLKRLADAEADGDAILAVVRGSATNQDGRSNGITAPNGPSQVAVIRQALADAGIDPTDVSYVETHGTGTALGDPIEVQALGTAIAATHAPDRPLLIGSVKTNLGHLESAAGIAGLIKVVLSLQQDALPRQLHFQTPSPHIAWDQLRVSVTDQPTPWPAHPQGRRIAGVSSFGFSGTNAHVIVEAAPPAAARVNSIERPHHVVSLSARSRPALRALAGQLDAMLINSPDVSLADVAYTANVGRSDFGHRAAVVAESHADVRAALAALRAGAEAENLIASAAAPSTPPEIVFLFTAQGAQYQDMGRRLYETQPTFRRALDRCAAILEPHLDAPLLAVIWSPDESTADGAAGLLDQTMYTQPALFAVQYALAELWRSWGIRPSAVLGHSAGELVAACVAGAVSLEDGLRLAAERGRLMQTLTPAGAMASVRADEQTVRLALAGSGGQVSVAAVNGPESVTIAGDRVALRSALAALQAQGVEVRELAISIASHSPLMDPMLDAFEQAAAQVTWREPQIDVISGMSGEVVRAELTTPAYWRQHAREAVQFARAVQTLRAEGYRHFLEIGPSPVLTTLGRQVFSDDFGVWLPSLRRGIDDWEQVLRSLGTLYVEGAAVDWAGFDRDYPRRKIALPTYPFEREHYWIETEPLATARAHPALADDAHPLLGGQLRSPAMSGTVFERAMDADSPSFLADHRVFDTVILPSPAFIEMALAVGRAALGSGSLRLENFTIREPLMLAEEPPRLVQTVLQPAEGGAATCAVYSRGLENDSWQHHTEVRICRSDARDESAVASCASLAEIRARCPEEIAGAAFYEQVKALGLAFGPAFRGIERIWRGEGEALAEVVLPDALAGSADAYWIHPAMLDACFQGMGAALPTMAIRDPYLLVSFDQLHVMGTPSKRLASYIRLRPTPSAAADAFVADVWLYEASGQICALVEGLVIRRASQASFGHTSTSAWQTWLQELRWEAASTVCAGGTSLATANWQPTGDHPVQSLRTVPAHVPHDGELADYLAAMPRLEQLAVRYARHALWRLGLEHPSPEADTLNLARSLGVVPRFQRLLGSMLGWLQQTDRASAFSAPRDGLTDSGPADDLVAEARALRAAHPCVEAELRLLVRCGEQLAEVLRGEIDPLHLLFPNGSPELVQPLYEASPSAQHSHHLMRSALEAALAGGPAGGRVRVLEIGAGTGATTASLLSGLPADRCEYVFTDISPLLLARAEARFADTPWVRFARLDAECDPLEQGFAAASFDIVIAANVLHATADLSRTLEHIRKLLAPGGLLLALEATRALRWVDLTFGLTEGWWRFTDTARRASHPLLSGEQWLGVLHEAGFVDPLTLPDDQATATASGQTVLVARQPVAMSVADAARLPSAHWTIFADERGVADALTIQIEAHGGSFQTVTRGPEYAVIAPGRIQVNADEAGDYGRVLDAAPTVPGQPHYVLHLWSLDVPTAGEPTEAMLASAERLGCGSALLLTQALACGHRASGAALWFATRDAQCVSAQDGASLASGVAQAPLWGFGRVVALEHPEFWGGLVDLSGRDSALVASSALFNVVVSGDDEDQVAIRGGQRLIARLGPDAAKPVAPYRWDPEASYLITGGLGGLGLKLARWMAEQGVRNFVLQSRSGVPERSTWSYLEPSSPARQQVDTIQSIEALGATVTVARADVADRAAMTALVNRFGSELPPLRGVVHAAAALDLSAIRDLDMDGLARMLRPKVTGTWLLHELTRALDLDIFVLFSSTTALLGVKGMAHYAAANEFLNAFAHYRQAQGYPALSICWGTWDEMRATSAEQRASYEAVGLLPMPAPAALAAFGGLLADSGRSQATVSSVDWGVLKPIYEARRRRPLLAEIKVGRPAITDVPGSAPSALIERLTLASSSERRVSVRQFVTDSVRRVLRLDARREIDPDRGLFDLGMDSLMAVELRSRLEDGIGQPLPSSLTFNYPNVAALTEFLISKIEPLLPPTAAAEASSEAQPVPLDAGSERDTDDQYDLSEHELAEMLSARLARMS